MRDVAEIVDVIRDVSGVKWNSDVEELLGLHSGVLANLKKHRRMESFMTPLMEYCSNRGFKACIVCYGDRVKVAFADGGTPPLIWLSASPAP